MCVIMGTFIQKDMFLFGDTQRTGHVLSLCSAVHRMLPEEHEPAPVRCHIRFQTPNDVTVQQATFAGDTGIPEASAWLPLMPAHAWSLCFAPHIKAAHFTNAPQQLTGLLGL
jgi:hypothetical protein